MIQTVLSALIGALGVYFGIGLLFGLFFLLGGASKVDPYMKTTPKGVRLLLFPGAVATWPFLLRNAFKKKTNE